MASVSVYTKSGGKSNTKFSLPKALFSADFSNHKLLQEAYLAAEANARHNLAATKIRSEIRGGGRKPHPQKGTGRARAGSSRNPLWRGGGVVFGPRGSENYSRSLNKSAKTAALVQALSLVAEQNRISVIEDFATNGKTASAAKLLGKLEFERGLIVLDQLSVPASRSLSNLAGISLTTAQQLSAADLLRHSKFLFTKAALMALQQRLEKKL